MRRHFLGSVVLLLQIGVLLASSIRFGSTDSVTIVVPDDFLTIQEAINNAVDGDTIFVKIGTYHEHVIVNKTVSLLGESKNTTIVDGDWTGITINVTRSGVAISNLTVRRSGSVYWGNAGIFLGNVENCTVNENVLTENPFAGLELNQSHRCIVSGNSILNNSGVGITMVGGSFNNLSRNSIVRNGWSALTINDDSHHNTISENIMTSNNLAVTGHCINLYRSGYNLIQKNNITGDDNGIRLEYWSNYNTIAKNDITDNTLAGLSVEMYSVYNAICQNTFSRNGFGFYIMSSTQNTIWQNSVVDNDQQAYVSMGSANNWDNGYPSGGNYWSDYVGVDVKSGSDQNQPGSDGIGDTPYVVVSDQDRYPLMKPYPWDPHDVGVTGLYVSKTVVGQGTALQVNVTMFNYGNNTENFSVAVYANTTIIHTFESIVLTSRNSSTVTFTWGTDGFVKGNYTLSAVADAVPGETDTADNNRDRWALVTLAGDVDGNRQVNIFDIVRMAGVYGVKLPDPRYQPNCDIDGDGDIDIFDIVLAAGNYGKSW